MEKWPSQKSPNRIGCLEVRQRLGQDQATMFGSNVSTEVDVVTFTNEGIEIDQMNSENDIMGFLRKDQEDQPLKEYEEATSKTISGPKSQYFILRLTNGWGSLKITMEGMLAILSSVDVFPQIYRGLSIFGRKSFGRDEAYGAFDSERWLGEGCLKHGAELTYILKYAERDESKSKDSTSWSIRHCLVYQKRNFRDQIDSHILIRMSRKMMEGLERILLAEQSVAEAFACDWTQIHLLFIESVEAGFRDFTNDLDEAITEVFDRITLSQITPGKLQESDTAEHSSQDLRRLEYLTDRARRLVTVIQVNLDTIDRLSHTPSTTWPLAVEPESNSEKKQSFLEALTNCRWEHQNALRNAMCIVKRSEALTRQLRDIISLRNHETNRLSVEATTNNTAATVELYEKSAYEAYVVKALTLLALVFAPASFVADFLQLDYVEIQDGEFHVWAKPGLRLYFVIACPLITLTLCIYILVEGWKRRSMRQRPIHNPV